MAETGEGFWRERAVEGGGVEEVAKDGGGESVLRMTAGDCVEETDGISVGGSGEEGIDGAVEG